MQNIVPYFKGHNHSCWMTQYNEDKLVIDKKTGATINHQQVIATMTSKPVNIFIRKKGIVEIFPAYYIDYLCVNKWKRKQGIAEQTIQTHEYIQRHGNRKIAVSLFKREGELTGIVPLCVYNTNCYDINEVIRINPTILISNTNNLIEASKSNMKYLFDFLNTDALELFEICISIEIANMLELINSNNLFVYYLLEEDEITSVYFFKKSCTYIKKDEEVLCLIGTINANVNVKMNTKVKATENADFVSGFYLALNKIREKNISRFQYIAIENISHNHILTDRFDSLKPYIETPTAYFFYNYIYHTTKPQNILMIL